MSRTASSDTRLSDSAEKRTIDNAVKGPDRVFRFRKTRFCFPEGTRRTQHWALNPLGVNDNTQGVDMECPWVFTRTPGFLRQNSPKPGLATWAC